MISSKSKIGIIGGSGFCKLPGLKKIKEISLKTKYGNPSSKIVIGDYFGKVIAFLARHGKDHTIPPHKIPYEANILALKKLGVECIIATSVVGSLQAKIKPGNFVIPDQFVNFTWGRDATIYSNFRKREKVMHISMAVPYCPTLRKLFYKCAKTVKIKIHPKGTVVVIQGPRFSTLAESKWFSAQGWDIINMTQYPECYLARKMKIHYATIAMVTDYDVGIKGSIQIKNDKIEKVVKIFYNNIDKTQKLLSEIIKQLPVEYDCECRKSLTEAYYENSKKEFVL